MDSGIVDIDKDDLSKFIEISNGNSSILDEKMHGSGGHIALAAPIIGVFSIVVDSKSFAHRDTCEVYGDINILDEFNNVYDIYSCGVDEAETITKNENFLSLSMTEPYPIYSTWRCMTVILNDRVDGSLILNETVSIDKIIQECDYDKPKSLCVGGESGSALITYAAFSSARLALVTTSLTVVKDLNTTATDLPQLHARISARYGNTYGIKYPGLLLFNEPVSQSESPNELSLNMVAFPSCSFLRIYVDLYDSRTNKPALNGKADFLASYIPRPVNIQAEGFVINVDVELFHPYQIHPEIPKIPADQVGLGSILSTISPDRESPRNVVPRNKYGSNDEKSSFDRYDCYWSQFLEVFTVMIHHDSNDDGNFELKICGEVTVTDWDVKVVAFNRDVSNPETLTADRKTIPIQFPRHTFRHVNSFIILDISDVNKWAVIKGTINCSSPRFEFSPEMWYDRRLCSVIRGVHGYATVFYTLFSSAVQALVEISFMSNASPDVEHRVHGTITARYSVRDCTATEYERSYYQSVLFDKHEKDPSVITSGSTLPLLKTVVAVPHDDYLKLVVSLYASPIDGSIGQPLKGVAEFSIGEVPRVPRQITSDNYAVKLTVQWGTPERKFIIGY